MSAGADRNIGDNIEQIKRAKRQKIGPRVRTDAFTLELKPGEPVTAHLVCSFVEDSGDAASHEDDDSNADEAMEVRLDAVKHGFACPLPARP